MADWPTVAIAIVSAGGALGGTYLKNLWDKRAQDRSAKREDAAFLRRRLEELLIEIDSIESRMNQAELTYLMTIQPGGSSTKNEAMPERVTFARLRSLVALHFPECQPHLDDFDKKDAILGNYFESEAKKKADIATTGAVTLVRRARNVSALAKGMRDELTTVAKSIGLSANDLTGPR